MIVIDANQRNPKFKNIYAVGVCVAIPPVEATPEPAPAPIETAPEAGRLRIGADVPGA